MLLQQRVYTRPVLFHTFAVAPKLPLSMLAGGQTWSTLPQALQVLLQ